MRREAQRLDDIVRAAEAIDRHLARGGLDDDVVFDAVRMRLVEIGEAVKGIGPELLASEPDIPWSGAAGLRDRLAHRYFDTDASIVRDTVENDLPPLIAAVERLRAALADSEGEPQAAPPAAP